MIRQISPTMRVCDDDATIIKLMKERRVYGKVRRMVKLKPGKDMAIFLGDEVFIRLGGCGGYAYMASTDPRELLEIMARVAAMFNRPTLH